MEQYYTIVTVTLDSNRKDFHKFFRLSTSINSDIDSGLLYTSIMYLRFQIVKPSNWPCVKVQQRQFIVSSNMELNSRFFCNCLKICCYFCITKNIYICCMITLEKLSTSTEVFTYSIKILVFPKFSLP